MKKNLKLKIKLILENFVFLKTCWSVCTGIGSRSAIDLAPSLVSLYPTPSPGAPSVTVLFQPGLSFCAPLFSVLASSLGCLLSPLWCMIPSKLKEVGGGVAGGRSLKKACRLDGDTNCLIAPRRWMSPRKQSPRDSVPFSFTMKDLLVSRWDGKI